MRSKKEKGFIMPSDTPKHHHRVRRSMPHLAQEVPQDDHAEELTRHLKSSLQLRVLDIRRGVMVNG